MSIVVESRSGLLRGEVVHGVRVFKGIPFAAAPFGPRRLHPPQPAPAWTGVRDALAFGPTCPQPLMPAPASALIPNPTIVGTECLNLNLWAPTQGSGRNPVMVWIPGGAFEFGTGAAYDGSRFARDGVVCVTINYRVGVDGFLCLEHGDANLGLLDQIAALEWVRDNIAAFGGDPDNVTLFGESAGGMSVGALLAMPRARGLFRRAIAQSGAAHHAIPAEIAHRVGALLARTLGVPATREAIASVSPDRLLEASARVKAAIAADPDPQRWGEAATSQMPWQPVIDGHSLPGRPIDCIAAGASADIDLLVGTTTDEWRLFLVVMGALDQITDAALEAAAASYGLPTRALHAYRAARPDATPGDLLAAIQTDWWCRVPALRLADAHAGRAGATYQYEFAWRSPQFGGQLGACHALEIPFVFDTLTHEAEPLVGPAPPQALADAMHAAWVRFATCGECGWPRYDRVRRTTMRFDIRSTVVEDPYAWERAMWEGIR